MATVARLLPRIWDGRRLLQFLTGLALIALAFALPTVLDQAAGHPAETPITIITTVDPPPAPGLQVTDVPSSPAGPGLALSPQTATSGAESGAGLALSPETATAEGAESGAEDVASSGPATVQGGLALPLQTRQGARGICAEARAAVAGSTQRAHGERGPPLA